MARRPKSSVVNSFTALKAVRDAQQKDDGGESPSATPKTGGSRAGAKPGSESGRAIGRTVMPTKHRITCYECEYVFTVAGRVGDTGCPKCHTTLKALDRKVEGEWTEDIKTIGTLRVLEGAVIRSGAVWAQDVVLEGEIAGGTVIIGGCLEVHPQGKVDLMGIAFRDLTVAVGASVNVRRKLKLRNLDVRGELHAKVAAEGDVRVRAGGLLKGGLVGAHLRVDEGGGLIGTYKVEGDGGGEPDESEG